MNIDNLLSVCSPAVASILKHLSARDLTTCSRVCKMWYELSKTEFKRREHIDWFLEVGHGCCRFKEFPSEQYAFQKKIWNSRIKPSFCLALLSEDAAMNFDDKYRNLLKTGLCGKKRDQTHRIGNTIQILGLLPSVSPRFFKQYLPPSCDFHWFATANIVSCYDDSTPVQFERGANMSGILISKCPGVEIHPIALNGEVTELPKGPIKCLFIIGDSLSLALHFIDKCATNGTEKFALAGGLVNENELQGRSTAFIFTGDNVEAASIVISKSVEEDSVTEDLKLFEKTGLLKNECFCIMFTCEQRYIEGNQESLLFKKIYPKVPLLGIFIDDAIGATYLPNVDSKDGLYQKKPEIFGYEDSHRGFVSVYLLVSIKKCK